MGAFENRDRIRDLEQRQGEVEDEIARLPITFPLASVGGGGGAPVSMQIVLIEDDIDGAAEDDPQTSVTASDIPLTAQEVTDGWSVAFEDPPGTSVSDLALVSYKRVEVDLKYYVGTPITGTATAGGTDTITLEVGSSSSDDFYNDDTVTAGGETKTIIDYVGSTRVATVDSDWVTVPDNTTDYSISSSENQRLAYTVTSDSATKKKTVKYSTKKIYYDDGKPFLMGEYERSDYPDFPENDTFPPSGLAAGFLNRKFRGIAINGILITVLCKALPPPELP